MARKSLEKQVHDNAIALISLVVAVLALFYNTWRAELTEENFNIRPAAFEMLKNLGQLQLLVNNIRYVHQQPKATNPILGWGYVSLISDLSQILPPPIPEHVQELVSTWQQNWEQISTKEECADKISRKIDDVRMLILDELKKLK
jgi:hypothetical protein